MYAKRIQHLQKDLGIEITDFLIGVLNNKLYTSSL